MKFIKNSMLFLAAAFILASCGDEVQMNEIAEQQNEYLQKVSGDLEGTDYLDTESRTQITEQLAQDLEDGYNPFDVEMDESKIMSVEEFEREYSIETNSSELSTRANCTYSLLGNVYKYPCATPGSFSPHNALYFVFNPDTEPRTFRYMLYRKLGGAGYQPMIGWTSVTLAAGQPWSLGGALSDGDYYFCVRDSECNKNIHDSIKVFSC